MTTTDQKHARIETLAKECVAEARAAAGSDPTDADGNSLLPDSPLPGDYVALRKMLDREPTAAEHEALESAYADAMSDAPA